MAGFARRSRRERMEKKWGRGRDKREGKEEEREDDRGERVCGGSSVRAAQQLRCCCSAAGTFGPTVF